MLRKLLSQTQIYNHSLPKKGLIYDKQFATYAVMKSFLDGDVKKGELLKVPMSKENSLEYVFYYIHNKHESLKCNIHKYIYLCFNIQYIQNIYKKM